MDVFGFCALGLFVVDAALHLDGQTIARFSRCAKRDNVENPFRCSESSVKMITSRCAEAPLRIHFAVP